MRTIANRLLIIWFVLLFAKCRSVDSEFVEKFYCIDQCCYLVLSGEHLNVYPCYQTYFCHEYHIVEKDNDVSRYKNKDGESKVNGVIVDTVTFDKSKSSFTFNGKKCIEVLQTDWDSIVIEESPFEKAWGAMKQDSVISNSGLYEHDLLASMILNKTYEFQSVANTKDAHPINLRLYSHGVLIAERKEIIMNRCVL